MEQEQAVVADLRRSNSSKPLGCSCALAHHFPVLGEELAEAEGVTRDWRNVSAGRWIARGRSWAGEEVIVHLRKARGDRVQARIVRGGGS